MTKIIWIKPNGTQIETNDTDTSIEEALRLGWMTPEQKKTAELAAELAAQAEAAAQAGELDSLGFPWDNRIHLKSREKLDDGTWKLRKNITDELIDSVRAEAAQK